MTRRPVSRVLFPHCWDRQPFLWELPRGSPHATHPGRRLETAHARPLLGLAPGGVYHARDVTAPAVGSYPTLSPLPAASGWRSALCGTFPRLSPGGRYPPPCFHGARTFLQRQASLPPAAARPSGQVGDIMAKGLKRQSGDARHGRTKHRPLIGHRCIAHGTAVPRHSFRANEVYLSCYGRSARPAHRCLLAGRSSPDTGHPHRISRKSGKASQCSIGHRCRRGLRYHSPANHWCQDSRDPG